MFVLQCGSCIARFTSPYGEAAPFCQSAMDNKSDRVHSHMSPAKGERVEKFEFLNDVI